MKDIKLFKIGEVAKLFHISVGLLRHYEKIELLIPEYIDEQSGYRYYSYHQFAVLHKILYLRSIDMPLEKIKDTILNKNPQNIQKNLLLQKELIHQKKLELQKMEDKLQSRIDYMNNVLNTTIDEIILKEQNYTLAILHQQVTPDNYYSLETSILTLEQQQKNIISYFGKVGIGISKEDLLNNKFNQYSNVFLILDQGDEYQGNVIEINKQLFVTYRFCGLHKNAYKYYQKVMNYIYENNFEVVGFSIEIAIVDEELTNNEKDFVTEIQIPVKKV